ncbi:hypothetical protein PV328_006450 [Microctonus aethiopoides]|uniref:CCR4-NOT transcription complex subunit 10 n=2 Tax=Microctonus aethiopoides TaxID=144406 RepID=A0AA39FP40_9HYME|nr:hypothetical protein PV328_006450 [Microctonus aethiopoides]
MCVIMSDATGSESSTNNKEVVATGAVVITEQERELAQNALIEFKKRSYSNCLNYLNKLETLRPKDLKVMHNKVIVEYYKSDLKKTELARKSLNAICGTPITVDDDNSTDASNDDVEKCVMRYNQAVLLYHTRQYEAALQILNRLFTFVEPMEENLAWKVCLLLIDIHMQTNRLDAALLLVNYVESQFISTDAAKLTSTAVPTGTDKETSTPKVVIKEKKNDNSDAATEAFKIKLLKYKARLFLMLQQPKLCKKEWKMLVSLGTPVNTSTIFLKAHLEYVRGNYEKSMKLLNSSTENLDYKSCGESAAVIYYNNIACINFSRGKPHLAAFYLQKALVENKKAVESVRVKDTNAAADSSQSLYTLGGDKHHELMFNLGVSLLQADEATKAFDCFIQAAHNRLHNSPELWLKMAECCIHCHKPSNKIDFDISKRRRRRRRQDLVQKVVGSGAHRKIILASGLNKDSRYHSESLSYAMPQPTLEFGMLCLKNALYSLPKDNSTVPLIVAPSTSSFLTEASLSNTSPQTTGHETSLTSSTSGGILGSQHPPTTPPTPSLASISQATRAETLSLKIAILAASSYVSLCLGDYIVALEHARALLRIEQLPGAYKMLGNLYAAECLILLDKINEAIDHLKLHHLEDLNTTIPILDAQDKIKTEECPDYPMKNQWFPTSINTAKGILRYNLAVAYAIRGELDKSGETLKQVWLSKGPDCDVPIHVIMLALYIELQLGHDDVARSIVKQHCPQYW